MAKDELRNPCTFKRRCIACKIVERDDRPTGCANMECEFYTPCSLCGMNVNIDPDIGHCDEPENCRYKKLSGEVEHLKTAAGRDVVEVSKSSSHPKMQEIEKSQARRLSTVKKRKVTKPGEPPSGLTEEEKEYYLSRWEDYEGYYRDPAAYLICHAMILEEIRLDWVQEELFNLRGEANEAKEKEKQRIYENLNNLKRQLPEKDSQKLSDDEKAIGMIYDTYCKEIKKIRRGGVTRVLSPEAIALVPELPFQLNPERMLIQCGFELQEAQDAAKKVMTDKEIKSSGLDTLTFLGFRLKEKYAMPFEGDMSDLDEDEFPDTDAGLTDG